MRSSSVAARVRKRIAEYSTRISEDERAAWQLASLNTIWAVISRRVPAHAEAVNSGRAPRKFKSIEEYSRLVPEMTKHDVQLRPEFFTDPSRPAEVMYTTGGSTGEPTSIPGWKSEARYLIPDRWMARAWYGITPMDNLFMIWGHSHLAGKGTGAAIKGLLRRAKDRLLGYQRFSAYNLDERRMTQAGDAILRMKPAYLIGYSGALDMLARANAHRAGAFAALKLKAVIASGEVFPAGDSAPVIRAALGAPVVMEYGSIETGVIAYTVPSASPDQLGWFHVMWRSYLLEAGDPEPDGSRPLLITALFPMKFPLVRYRIGDEAMIARGVSPLGLTRLERVVGRTLEPVALPGGGVVHFDVFEQAVTGAPGVRRFQLLVQGTELTINIYAPGSDHEAVRRYIRAALMRLEPRVAATPIVFTDRLLQTVAGKTPAMLRLKGRAA